MIAQLIFAMLLLLLTAACTPPPRPEIVPPVPPPIQPAKPRALKPGPGDRLVHNCIVTKQGTTSVDCVCRHMSDKIDTTTGAHSLECRETK
jgi:hypothetical protein